MAKKSLNDITFQKQNGGMGRTAPSADPISGLLMSLGNEMSPVLQEKFEKTGEGTGIIFAARIRYYEQLSLQLGIIETNPEVGVALTGQQRQMNAIAYHVREFFRMSPAGTLYLGIKASGDITGEHIKTLQYFSGGEIRQVGIFSASTVIADYQEACTGSMDATGLFDEHQPLSVIAAPKKSGSIDDYADENLSQMLKGRANVSVLISRDLDSELDEKLGVWAQYGCIGTVLGALSAAMVHESIAWVQKFPLGLKVPGFITEEPVRRVNMTTLNMINDNRYLFVRTHVGNADNYLNDSHTLDEPESDYAYIENTRTMDKATRGIRANLLPQLNAPLYVDPATGKLRPDTVAFLETTAGRALEDMERAGELSGFRAEIDPEQEVLKNSTLEIVIRNVPVGVMRKVIVKIGYTTAL